MAARTVPLTAGTKDWPRQVSKALQQLGLRLTAVEPLAVAITADYTVEASGTNLVLADATAGPVKVSLPAAADSNGMRLTVKKIDASVNNVTIDPNASETIDGATTKALTARWQSSTVQCDGTAWFIL